MIEGRVFDIEVEEPLEQEIVVKALTEPPFARHRIENDEERTLEQMLGSNRRAAGVGIHLCEERRQLSQCNLNDGSDVPDGVVSWNLGIRRDRRERRLSEGRDETVHCWELRWQGA